MSETKSRNRTTFIIIGVVCVLPGSLACLATLLIPSVHTMILSVFDVDIFRGSSEFIGLEAYAQLLEFPGTGKALSFTMLLMVERLVIVCLLPLVLALLVNDFGRAVRIPARLLFTIPLAMFSPIVTYLTWHSIFYRQSDLTNDIPLFRIGSPTGARLQLLTIDALTTFGLACGLGLIIYLLAFRGREGDVPSIKSLWLPVGTTWFVSIAAVVALSLQEIRLPLLTTSGGPIYATATLPLLQLRMSVVQFQFPVGGAIGTPLLIVLGLLGIVVSALIVFGNLQIERVPISKMSGTTETGNENKSVRILAGIALALAGLSALVLFIMWAFPIVSAGVNARLNGGFADLRDENLQLGRAFFLYTLIPALISVFMLQLPITTLTALGIGAMRPLGKRSELLLLLFCPWLFVTITPLMYSFFLQASKIGILNTWPVLILPTLINVPALFVLTLFFKGAAEQWNSKRETGEAPFFKHVVLPALPLIGLIGAGLLLINLQNIEWPMVVMTGRESMPMPLLIFRTSLANYERPEMVNALITRFGRPLAVAFFLIFAAFQVFYLDRLALVTGKRDEAESEIGESVDEVAEPEPEKAPAKTPRKKKKPAEDSSV
ncbi:MAG: sugar ABC transporter permease [Anaerolineae bacterium]|nr:sugar ABC transporter permease [Anaerolineae bacterium]